MVPENTEDRPIIFHFRNSSTFHLVRGKTFYMKIWKGQWIEWLRLHWGNLPSSTSGMCKYTLIYFKFARKLSNDVTTFLLFSFFFHRQPTKDVNRQVMSRNSAPEKLWLHSREPLKQPLLKKLLHNTDLSHKACLAFTDILHIRCIVGLNAP